MKYAVIVDIVYVIIFISSFVGSLITKDIRWLTTMIFFGILYAKERPK